MANMIDLELGPWIAAGAGFFTTISGVLLGYFLQSRRNRRDGPEYNGRGTGNSQRQPQVLIKIGFFGSAGSRGRVRRRRWT